jgi:hypothetical protein
MSDIVDSIYWVFLVMGYPEFKIYFIKFII